jgi:hypothetical protein
MVVETLGVVAAAVAADQATHVFQEAKRSGGGSERHAASDRLLSRMKALMAENLAAKPAFAAAARAMYGKDIEAHLWKLLAMFFSHETLLEPVPDGQTWLID